MPYDPRAAQLTQFGIGMLGPQASPFGAGAADQPQRPKQWWEMVPQMRGGGQSANASPDTTPSAPGQSANQRAPSLLQMLMLGGPATYSGAPKGGGAPSGSYGAIPSAGNMNLGTNPWGWLGGLGGFGGGAAGQ